MNGLAVGVGVAAAGLAALVAFELRPLPAAPPAPPATSAPSIGPAAAPVQEPGARPDVLAATLLARPLFTPSRRPPGETSPASASPAAETLPRMTAILIDGSRRSAIFVPPGGKPTVVAEGGRIGPFVVRAIEPERVIVAGPDGERTVHTSFDPDLQPPPPPAVPSPGIAGFPGLLQATTPPPNPLAAPAAGLERTPSGAAR
ncbi:MAG: hypothetical protein RQ966_00445 [Acetobacteraceae bacterium]|nr:hypothetical protein [Acetobacteraceae bacterium]